MRAHGRALVIAMVGGLGGCIDALAPDVGPLVQAACSDTDSDPDVDVRFADDVLGGVFARRCAACHTPGGATPIGLTVGGLDLSSYASTRRGGARAGADIVIAGEPCASVLVQKISEAPPFGARMPLEGASLSLAEQQLIVDWIAEGARAD